MMELYRSSLFLVSIFSLGICHLYVEQIVPDEAHTVNYIFITDRDYTWQEAREVCASLNASLVKIDSWDKYIRLRRLYNSTEYWNEIPKDDAWTGTVHTQQGFQWHDCQPFDFSSFVHFKDDGSLQFDSSKQCYRTKKDLDFALELRDCTERNGVICEQQIEGDTCPLSTLISLELKENRSISKADCIDVCESDVTCYAIVSYSNAECLLMTTNGVSQGGSSEVTIAIRQCIRGEVKDKTQVITPTPVNNKIPELHCNSTAGNNLEMATSSYVYMPASCHNITETVNVTETESVTIFESFILTEQAATTEYVYVTENVTITENVTMINHVTATENVSVTNYITVTENVTVTEHLTPNTITTTVISSAPYPVTVALSPTPSSSVCESKTTYINITNTELIKESVENISKALYLDKRTTSAYVRLKTSAPDNRTSSMTMGSLGIVCVVVPLSLILLADLRTIYCQVMKTCRSCQKNQLGTSPT